MACHLVGAKQIVWTNAGILLIGPWGTNFSETLTSIRTFSVKKIHLKMSSAKWRPFCLGFNVLTKQDNTNTVKHVPYTILNTYLLIGHDDYCF